MKFAQSETAHVKIGLEAILTQDTHLVPNQTSIFSIDD